MNILDKIDKLRKERNWSINYLAMEAMLTQSTVNNLYVRQTDPKISTLQSICGAFGITLSEFFSDEDEEDDGELIRRVRTLSAEQKEALLVILRSIN